MMKLPIAALALLGVPAQMNTPVDADPLLPFECEVSGNELLDPALTKESVCFRVARQLGRGFTLRGARSGPPADIADRLHIDVEILPLGHIVARVTSVRKRVRHNYPEISVSKSDKPLGLAEVDFLGREISKVLKKDEKF